MNERLIGIPLAFQGEGDADGVMGVYVPVDFRLVKVSHFVAVTGTETLVTIDIQDDTVDVETAMDIKSTSNGITALTTPAEIAADSVIEIDLNLTDATAVTGEITLWGYVGE
jgi:hypothetical protein